MPVDQSVLARIWAKIAANMNPRIAAAWPGLERQNDISGVSYERGGYIPLPRLPEPAVDDEKKKQIPILIPKPPVFGDPKGGSTPPREDTSGKLSPSGAPDQLHHLHCVAAANTQETVATRVISGPCYIEQVVIWWNTPTAADTCYFQLYEADHNAVPSRAAAAADVVDYTALGNLLWDSSSNRPAAIQGGPISLESPGSGQLIPLWCYVNKSRFYAKLSLHNTQATEISLTALLKIRYFNPYALPPGGGGNEAGGSPPPGEGGAGEPQPTGPSQESLLLVRPPAPSLRIPGTSGGTGARTYTEGGVTTRYVISITNIPAGIPPAQWSARFSEVGDWLKKNSFPSGSYRFTWPGPE